MYISFEWSYLKSNTFVWYACCADVAHGNFSVESGAVPLAPAGEETTGRPSPPVSTVKQQDSTYLTVVICVLMAVVILLLAFAIFLIVNRHRQRKCFASPLASKATIPAAAQHLSAEKNNISYRYITDWCLKFIFWTILPAK